MPYCESSLCLLQTCLLYVSWSNDVFVSFGASAAWIHQNIQAAYDDTFITNSLSSVGNFITLCTVEYLSYSARAGCVCLMQLKPVFIHQYLAQAHD